MTTITPGVPSAAEMDAYNAARTPQISVVFNAPATPVPGASATGAATRGTATTATRPVMAAGACTLITLPAATGGASPKTSRSVSASTATAGTQPVTTVNLTYDQGSAGQLVWVQMQRGGTLSATDGAGKTYDGSHGFFLTLDAGGRVTFNYQAPNASGTYQVLTRYTNVKTVLPFVVPDPVP